MIILKYHNDIGHFENIIFQEKKINLNREWYPGPIALFLIFLYYFINFRSYEILNLYKLGLDTLLIPCPFLLSFLLAS
jgi:hypothetical protein